MPTSAQALSSTLRKKFSDAVRFLFGPVEAEPLPVLRNDFAEALERLDTNPQFGHRLKEAIKFIAIHELPDELDAPIHFQHVPDREEDAIDELGRRAEVRGMASLEEAIVLEVNQALNRKADLGRSSYGSPLPFMNAQPA